MAAETAAPMGEKASGLWRSETMVLLSMSMQREVAHAAIYHLGMLGSCQFRDLNEDLSFLQREYINDVRRCEDMERRLRAFTVELTKACLPGSALTVRADSVVDSTLQFDALESKLETIEKELNDANNQYQALLKQKNSTLEFLEILKHEGNFFRGSTSELLIEPTSSDPQGSYGGPPAAHLLYLTGVIVNDKLATFERLVYRICRGNMFIRSESIKEPFFEPDTGALVEKSVFVVFFSAQRVKDKVKKICESLQATLYPYTAENPQQSAATLREHQDALHTLELTLSGTEASLSDMLTEVSSSLHHWKVAVATEKGIYETMNMVKFDGQTGQAEAWAPLAKVQDIRDALQVADALSSAQVGTLLSLIPTSAVHPTYFQTNRFTECFQSIVDSYGIARYKEVNPGVFTIITFPFLFGVMYGDMGHGLLITVAGLAMILMEKSVLSGPRNEMFDMIFGGRYVIFLMGLFATYMGVLYNDCFGLMLSMFGGSHFTWIPECFTTEMIENKTCGDIQSPYIDPSYGNSYHIGVDPGWASASNRLDFYNSLKMKMGVILGVFQMMVGIVLSCCNHLYFNHKDHIWFEFIPEVIFLTFTFGYMDFIIIVKWLTNWTNGHVIEDGSWRHPTQDMLPLNMSTNLAPSLLQTMTDFFLAPGSRGENMAIDLYPGQYVVQAILLIVAFLSIPFLLCPIPIIEYRKHKKELLTRPAFSSDAPSHRSQRPWSEEPMSEDFLSPSERVAAYGTMETSGGAHFELEEGGLSNLTADTPQGESNGHGGGGGGHGDEPFDMSEIVIKQVIHTIEFVLGCVSNTASYLRLWALSLAHAQLSEVFWDFAFIKLLEMDPGIGVYVFFGFAVWLGVTIGVLVLMEALSAFLHALRLHWVEFQNKFYAGDGLLFTPIDLKGRVPWEEKFVSQKKK